MEFPKATRVSAFLAGASLALLAIAMATLKKRGVIPYDADDPQLFLLVVAYFFVTVVVFVIDVRSLAPVELKTRIPGVYFPTNRQGWSFMTRVWGRMIVWFVGAAGVGALAAILQWGMN